jgi:peptidylprolyl isomerase
MTTNPRFSALLLAAVALPLAAQTPTAKPATTTAPHTTAVHHTVGGCTKLPEISAKIPALPSDAPCAKILYTLTRTADTKLDYASPLLSPELKASLGGGPSTYSLVYIDTKIGTGELAKPGKFYTVHYTGYLAKDGTKFDSSVDRGDPITFPYGGHRVIPGWDSGFEGMHVGGKRRLFIPYQLAYGDAGHPPVIPAKSQLVFDVEFISQGDTQPAPKAPAKRTQPSPVQVKPMPGATPPPAGAPAPATPPPATPASTTPAPAPTTPPASGTNPPPASAPPPSSATPPSKPQ